MPLPLRSGALLGLCLLLAGALRSARGQQPDGDPNHKEPKLMRGRLELTSGERYCVPVPLHPDRAINLGVARLTVTFSSESKGKTDIVLEPGLTKAQVMLKQSDTAVTLCGAVPALSSTQAGAYTASDFAIHLGSGNVTNIGAPDDHLVDTAALATQLQALRVTFRP